MSEVIIGILSFSALIFIYAVLYKRYCIDRLREKLFEIRSKLFDLASSDAKEFHFNHSLYISFENALNGSITVATETNLIELFVASSYIRKNKIEFQNTLSSNLNTFKGYCNNVELTHQIVSLKKDYELAILKYLWISSAFLGTALVLSLLIKHFLKFSKNISKKDIKSAFDIPITEFENQAQNVSFGIAA